MLPTSMNEQPTVIPIMVCAVTPLTVAQFSNYNTS